MSDFLANLVERTMTSDLVVRPKLLTPYELHPTSLVGFEPVVEQLDIDEAPANAPVSVGSNERDTERHRSRRQEPEAPALEKTVLPKVKRDFEVLEPHPTVRQTDVAIEEPKRTRIKDSQPGSPEAVQITEPTRSTATVSKRSFPKTPLKLDRPSRRESTIAQRFQNLNSESPLLREDNRLVAAPSSITIRIGRVEVRASLPASPHAVNRIVSAQPRSPERPSLNDYLEQRSRGGKS